MLSLNRKHLLQFETYFKDDTNENIYYRIVLICKDIIKYKLHLQNNETHNNVKNRPYVTMKINYINRGIELIKLEQILNNKNIQDTIPMYNKKPTVIFKYIAPIRNKIFNKDTIQNIKDFDNIKCCCDQFDKSFCNDDIGHIITGDLNIEPNKKLRTLITYGPNYRIPAAINWENVFNEVQNAIDTCIPHWSRKSHRDVRVFNEWKTMVILHTKCKIEKLKNNKYINKNVRHNVNTLDAFNDRKLQDSLKTLHKNFVVVNADKASNNVIIICKKII